MTEQMPYLDGQQYYSAPTAQHQYGPPPLPKSNVGWAVAVVVFFWPSFSAFTHALNVFPR